MLCCLAQRRSRRVHPQGQEDSSSHNGEPSVLIVQQQREQQRQRRQQQRRRTLRQGKVSFLSNPIHHTCASPLGVHVSVVQKLLKEAESKGYHSTADICENVVKPFTDAHKCALVDMVEESFVSKATCFISHAWSCSLEDTVNVMQQVEEEHPNTFFWFDVIVNNQHSIETRQGQPLWGIQSFRTTTVEKIGSFVLVLPAWNDVTPLRRCWCLYEMMCALNAHRKINVQIKLPSHQHRELLRRLRTDFEHIVNNTIGTDITQSSATLNDDKHNIFKAVEETISLNALNVLVDNVMRKWIIKCGEESVKELSSLRQSKRQQQQLDRMASLCSNIANMMSAMNDHNNALIYLKKVLNICDRSGNNNSKKEIRNTNNGDSNSASEGLVVASAHKRIANIYTINGDQESAFKHHNKALQIQLYVLGDGHIDIAPTYDNMGDVSKKRGDFDNALGYYSAALSVKKAAYGETHPSVAASLSDIASAYSHLEDNVKAIEFYDKAINVWTNTCGDNHHSTAASIRGKGDVFFRLGNFRKAKECYTLALNALTSKQQPQKLHIAINEVDNKNKWSEIKGNDISDEQKAVAMELVSILESFAELFLSLGDYNSAMEHLNNALSAAALCFGDTHPRVVKLYTNLGFASNETGEHDRAMEYYGRAFTSMRRFSLQTANTITSSNESHA
eukprot:m.114190 g.114190  ORF g.114190 m.114190 type:complete len:676 (-) comp12814_c0_seq1:190-2217(-)